MKSYDVIVLGGGLLGCFAARNLMRYDLKVALLEKREDICTGISRSNTAIVYSGCDIKPGTTKAAMTVRAAKNFHTLCDELGVRFSRCGSLMVSFGENGTKVLERKLEMGRENGVADMRLLNREEVLALEPNLAPDVCHGLFVPDTGTVLPWEFCLAGAENAAANGAEFLLNTEVLDISRNAEGLYELRTADEVFTARAVVNAAGLDSDKFHEQICEPSIRIVPTLCDYIMLDTKAFSHIKHIVFHEPEQKSKGLTLVPTVDGNILIGSTERAGEDYKTSSEGLQKLFDMAARVMPSLPMDQMIRSFGAMRPNPYAVHIDENGEYHLSEKSVNDFCIMRSADDSFISFIAIKTPGLTCSDELGSFVAAKIAAYLQAGENTAFDPHRAPQKRLNEMSFAERRDYTKSNAEAYSRVVCRCRDITEGEIVDAIHRFPQATVFEAVKRRTGAASGRCQGSFCMQRIIEIMARELGCTPQEILKDKAGSYIFQ